MKLTRSTPYKFKNGKIAKNRVVVPPMASQTANTEGHATKKTIEHYANLSSSGAGIVFVEYSHIHSSGRGEGNQLSVDSDDKIPGLKQVASVIKDNGALAGLQLVHVGGKTTIELAHGPLMAPSSIPVPVKGWQPETPQAMTPDQIELWVQWFVGAAKRAALAGFDLVELHAAHGYGLNQWLSPITNQRQDGFGGSIANRAQLLFTIVTEIKSQLPHLMLAVRLPAQDHFIGGLATSEMVWVAKQLETLGVDLLDVSSGIGGWRRPEGHQGQGYLVPDATLLKTHVSVPTIGVGGIETGLFIDELVSNHKVDFAAVGRAILSNPSSWGLVHLCSSSSNFGVAM